MEKRLCAACRQLFKPRPQASRQAYCKTPACQRERRRRWHKAKRRSDPDYQENQRNAQHAWCARNPNYWREYRRTHAEYRERNKQLQRTRRHAAAKPTIAKMDVCAPMAALQPGLYRIVPAPLNGVAKKNAWMAEITWISGMPGTLCGRCKERTR